MFNHIIRPIVAECGYTKIIRADQEDKPGHIGTQIISRLIDSDLVVADLTGHNPNVFYELAIRHSVHKPVVQIIKSGESIPFDVAQMRTIMVDLTDLDSAENCKSELKKQILHLQKDPSDFDSPVSQKILLDSINKTNDPESQGIATIIDMIQSLDRTVDRRIERSIRRFLMDSSEGGLSRAQIRRIAIESSVGLPFEMAKEPAIINEIVELYMLRYSTEFAPTEIIRGRLEDLWMSVGIPMANRMTENLKLES